MAASTRTSGRNARLDQARRPSIAVRRSPSSTAYGVASVHGSTASRPNVAAIAGQCHSIRSRTRPTAQVDTHRAPRCSACQISVDRERARTRISRVTGRADDLVSLPSHIGTGADARRFLVVVRARAPRRSRRRARRASASSPTCLDLATLDPRRGDRRPDRTPRRKRASSRRCHGVDAAVEGLLRARGSPTPTRRRPSSRRTSIQVAMNQLPAVGPHRLHRSRRLTRSPLQDPWLGRSGAGPASTLP